MASATPTPTARPRGQIRLRPAKPEERATIARIHFDAFGTGPMESLLLGPGGLTEDVINGFSMDMFPGPDHDASSQGERFITLAEFVPEDEAGQPEVVAFGKWALYRNERSEAQWDVEEPAMSEEKRDDTTAEVMDAFLGDLHRRARALAKGEPHLHLNILACKTSYGRLGAGSAILRSGLEIADELGIAARLEASPPGYNLYKRYGFEPVVAQDLEVTKRWGKAQEPGSNWGQDNAVETCGPLPEGHFRTVFMRRPPKGAASQ